MTYTVGSFFSGVGGIDLGFEQANFKIIYANEIDKYAAQTYALNFDNQLDIGDIKELKLDSIPNFDILIGGFPCQAFSIAGYRKGFEDERGNLFFDLLKIITKKKPRVILLENVKNLVGHDKGNTYKVIREALTENGYHLRTMVLNASEYGNVPQNRERIYIVGFRKKSDYTRFDMLEPIPLTQTIHDMIIQEPVDDRYYYDNGKYSFVDELQREMKNKDTVYQWRRKYLRENKSNVCPTLTANMGTGGHNVPLILSNQGIRKLTPRECFSFQGFPSSFKLPEIADSHLYKQSGNSVIVPVIKRIATSIMNTLKENDKKRTRK